MEQLLQETMQSASVAEISKALVKAQAMMGGAKHNKRNPFFGSTYADLGSVMDVIRKPFTDNGLAIVQQPLPCDVRVRLMTTLLHASGEWIKSVIEMQPTKPGPQEFGSCLTYARRYALAAIAGVCSDEDDDGNAATHDAPKNKEHPRDRDASKFHRNGPDSYYHGTAKKDGRPYIAVIAGDKLAPSFLDGIGAKQGKDGKWYLEDNEDNRKRLDGRLNDVL